MPDTPDDNAGTTMPGATPEAPSSDDTATAQTAADQAPPAAPAYAAPPAGPRAPSTLRRHWGLIVGAVAIAILLLLGGTAIGAVVAGDGAWGDRHGFRDGPFGRGDDDRGGQMMGPGGQGYGQGGQMMGPGGQGYGQGSQGYGPGSGGDCPRDSDDGNGGYGPGYGPAQPNGQPCPGCSPAPETSPNR